MSSNRQYVTTAIDYPNAAPHMGHALEKILADVAVRWFRLRGDEVRFQIGTDEHGIKIQQSAAKAGKPPAEFVAENRRKFVELYDALNISYDPPFMHTSDNPGHRETVQALWKKLAAATHADGTPVLEKRAYTALYCTGCERFITKKELVDGKCPDHAIPPQEVTEQNWFFTLSKDAEFLKGLLQKAYRIIPDFRAPETLTLLEGGLEDVSFSRPKGSLSWGIPVPGDEEQTMYVWCDALTNYISGLGYLTDKEDKRWWDDATVTHVIGKDIARFHALIWPAMLHHAGIRTPDRLLIHGFLTSEGQKMSKSLGNVVAPQEIIDTYGVEALRFYLTHEIPVGNDGDFSWKRFSELYDAKLRNQLGNLLNRILVLLQKQGGGIAVPAGAPEAERIVALWAEYTGKMDAFDFHGALQATLKLVDEMNARMNEVQPWKLEGEQKTAVLSGFAEQLRHVAMLLLPFLPATAATMLAQLGVPAGEGMAARDFHADARVKAWGGAVGWTQAGTPAILFAPVEVKKEA